MIGRSRKIVKLRLVTSGTQYATMSRALAREQKPVANGSVKKDIWCNGSTLAKVRRKGSNP